MKRVFSALLISLCITLSYSQVAIVDVEKNHSLSNNTSTLYLHEAKGSLEVIGNALHTPYTLYFIVPLSFEDQTPIWFEIDSPEVIDYRFIKLSNFNTVVAATLNNHPDTINLNWTSYVLVKHKVYSGIPPNATIPSISDLPDSVLSWLHPSACVQWNDQFVKHLADSIRGNTDNLMVLANRIKDYCYDIPWEFPHQPYSFDAFYAMKWGNSCTGRAHAAAAIFRANNIPCRVLLNMPTFSTGTDYYDMHWIIEYYIPHYGWVKMETSLGYNPYFLSHEEAITFVCNIEDEFSITYPDNLEAYWFGSDTIFNHFSPDWGRGHTNSIIWSRTDSSIKINEVLTLCKKAYAYNVNLQGILLSTQQETDYSLGLSSQFASFQNVKNDNLDSAIYYLKQGISYYNNINYYPFEELFKDNFENGSSNWLHGGIKDNWEIGTPTVGPTYCYSGNKCMGSNLHSIYDNNVDSWIESPSIGLMDLSCARLNFKIWNNVEDYVQQKNPKDRLWIELSLDNGLNYFPLTTCFGGVNDDPLIPSFGGWSNVVLDLNEFIDSDVKFRFRFTSNDTIRKVGSYIDDFTVYGRKAEWAEINESRIEARLQGKCYPNPFVKNIKIIYTQPCFDDVIVTMHNIEGQSVYKSTIVGQKEGKHEIELNASSYKAGVYNITINTCNQSLTFKLIKL